ncbi:MAG: hypothetical protein ACREAA_04950 [Candidatus Polarisedimenticolia bacterium]
MSAGGQAELRLSVFIGSFLLLTALFILVNIYVLGLGDPKFPRSSRWSMYFTIWTIAYSPAVLLAAAIGETGRHAPRSSLFYRSALVVILSLLETSFLLDAKWPWLIAEQGLILIVVLLLRRRLKAESI